MSDANRSRLRGIYFTVAAFCVLPINDGIAKYIIDDFHVVQIVWGRFLFQSIAIVGWLALSGRLTGTRSGRHGLLLPIVVIGWLANFPIITSLAYLPLADAIAIGLIAPFLVTALSVPLLRERVGLRRWMAVLLGFVGALVVIRPGASVFHWAALLPLLSATFFAFFQIGVRKLGSVDSPLTILAYGSVVPLVLNSLALPFVWVTPDLHAWTLLAVIGVGAAVGQLLVIAGLHLAPPSVLAPLMYFQLVSSTLFGFFVFGDLPDGLTVIGAAIIVMSGIYVAYRERVRR